jgi:branched-chain amino acid transport system permease protein
MARPSELAVRTAALPRFVGVLALLLAAAAIVAIPFLPNYYIRVADSLLIYILLGIGLNIVIGYAGLLDLGFVAFYAVGAYTYALLASPQLDLHLPFLVILPIGILLGGIAGVLLGFPVLRLRGDYLAIVTLGFGEIIRIILNNADTLTSGPQGIARLDRADIFGLRITTPVDFYWLLLITVTLVGIIVWRLETSIIGKGWAAIREDQDAARGIGIDTTRAKLAAFAISAMIGSTAGVIFGAFQRFVSPESFTFHESVLIVLLIVIGGIGNILGVVAGASVLLLLPEVLREFAEWRILFFGVLMVALIILRPQGLVPRSFGPEKLFGALLRR